MNNNWYAIPNLEEFINQTRLIVYTAFGETSSLDEEDFPLLNTISSLSNAEKEELDSVLSYDESYTIIIEHLKKQTHKKTKDVRFLLSDKSFVDIIENLNHRMISNMLQNLASRGILESGFDSESNDFIFWISDEKPETD